MNSCKEIKYYIKNNELDLEKIINKPIKILNKSEVLNIVRNATNDKRLTIVCGSFYMLGEIFEKKAV